jgi:hypothetical protein
MESLPCRIPVARMPWRKSMARRCSLRYLLLLLLCPFVLGSVRLELERRPDGGVGYLCGISLAWVESSSALLGGCLW